MSTGKFKCSCSNEYQDQQYGKGIRVMNSTEKGNSTSSLVVFRCTICKTEHFIQVKQREI